MTGLNAGTHDDRCRTLEYALCRFVFAIPRLHSVAEDFRDPFDVHLPRGIETCIVDGSEVTDCRGEMARVANRAVEQVRIIRGIIKGVFYSGFYILLVFRLRSFFLFGAVFYTNRIDLR